MFKFKRKDKEARASHKLLRASAKGKEPAPEPKPARYRTLEEAQQQRLARFDSTSTTMLAEDVEDAYAVARGGTEVYVGGGLMSSRSNMDSTRSYDSSMSYDDNSSNCSGYSGYSSTSSRSMVDGLRSATNSGLRGTDLRATGLETLNEMEEEVVDRSTARYVGPGVTPTTPAAVIRAGDADLLRAELREMKQEMQAIKREMMNEMHLTRYDVLKEVTMLKGTIMQLVSVIQQSGGVHFDTATAAAMGIDVPPQANELSPEEKEALSRKTTTVVSKVTKERITTTREDQIPPVLRSTSSRLTQLAPVDDSALSTPLHQEQIDDMFPLIDFSAEVQIQSRIRETGSREWVFDRVQEWLDSRFNVGADVVLAMVGDAGSGKTVAAASVCDKYEDQVVAKHFCKFDRKAKSSPRNVLLSLVNQLTSSLPMFKSQLARLNLKYVLEETDVPALSRKVLIDPLNALEEPLTPKFVVFDAIDQCRTGVGYNDLQDFLSAIIPECPKWLGFLVSSKPSPEFAVSVPVSSVLDFSAQNANYMNDTVFLINDIAAVFHDNDQEEAKQILKTKSGGNYSYLEFTKQALSNPGMEEASGFVPVDVLHDLPQSLYEIYEEIFEDKFGKGRTRVWRKALPVLQLIFTAASGPYAQITEQNIMDSLSYTKDEVRMLRRAFIDIISIRHGTYAIVSSAVYDWLTDQQRKGEQFFIDVNLYVKVLRKVLRGEKLNMPGTSSSGTSERSTMSRSGASISTSSTSSSDRSSGGSNNHSTPSTRTSSSSYPAKLHEPNLNPSKPVGILKNTPRA